MGVLNKLKKVFKGKDLPDTSKKALASKQRKKPSAPKDEQSFRRKLIEEKKKQNRKVKEVRKQFENAKPSSGGSATGVKRTDKPKAKVAVAKTATDSYLKKVPEARNSKIDFNKDLVESRARQRERLMSEYNKRTNDRYNVEKNGLKARQAIKSGDYMSDPEVAKFDVDKHPIASSAARGALSGVTFGMSDLAINKLPMNPANREAEEYYQAHKNKGAEIAGEIAGSLASFGLTGGASKAVVGKGATKLLGKEAVEKATTSVVDRVAGNALIRRAAMREALKKVGTTATEKEIAQFARNRAIKLVDAIGEDMAINLTTGAVSDISHAILDSDDPKSFMQNMAASAGMNLALGGATTVLPSAISAVLPTGRAAQTAENAAESLARNADEAVRPSTAENAVRPPETGLPPVEEVERMADELEARNAKTEAEINARQTAEPPKAAEVPKPESVKKADKTEKALKPSMKMRKDELKELAAKKKIDVPENATKRDILDLIKKNDAEPAVPKAEPAKAEAPKAEPKPLEQKSNPNRKPTKSELQRAELYTERKKLQKEYDKALKEGKDTTAILDDMQETDLLIKDLDRKIERADKARETRIKKAEAKKKENPRVVERGQDIVNKRVTKPTMKEKLSKVGDDVRMKMADSHAPFEDEARKYAKSNPEKMQDMYGAIDAHRRSGAVATRSVDKTHLDYNGRPLKGKVVRNDVEVERGKSLKDIFKGMDEDTETDFNYYLLLKHAPARAKEGTPIFDNTFVKGGVNIGDDPKAWESEAKKILDTHPEFAQKAEEVYQYLEDELQNLVDAGIVSKEAAAKWQKEHPFYVPTHRAGDSTSLASEIQGNAVSASERKAAVGSDKDIRSIRDQIEEATRQNWSDITLNDMLKSTFGDKLTKDTADELADELPRAIENIDNFSKSLNGKKYFANISIDGKRHRIEVDKKFVDAIQDWGKNGRFGSDMLDIPNEVISKGAKVWKSLITEWSPIFMVKNPMRDIPEAFINSRQSKEFFTSFPAAIKDLATGGPYSEALRNAGISQSSFFDLDKAIKEDIDAARRNAVSKAARAALDKLESGNQFMELLPRLAEYMATFKKAGKSLEDADKILLNRAAANAADVTVNFGRSGSLGKALNKGYIPFFNPSAQGWSKFARNITEQPGARAYLSFFAKALSLGAGLTVLNNYLLKDNPNYQQISGRDKTNNIIIPLPRKDGKPADEFIKIPKSRFASAYSLLPPAANAFNENKMGWAEVLQVANDQVAPIDPIDSHFGVAFIQAKKGKTWYGTDIVPKALEDRLPSEQYDPNTSGIGRALGKATEKLPKDLQISPKKADYVIDAETGVIGDFLLPMTTKSRQSGGKNPAKKAGYAGLNVLKRQFTIDSVSQNNLSSKFYDKLGDAKTMSESLKSGKKDKEEYKRLLSYSKEVSGLTKAITYLQGSDRPTKQEDMRELQKVRNQFMQDALDGKAVPTKIKKLDAVQKYVGTTYAINNFGSSEDKEAMKIYGAAKYGNISKAEMVKKIDADKKFYKGVKAIGKLEDKIAKAGVSSDTALTKAVALASVDADNDLFGAYKGTKQSRTETANKMVRARRYFKDGGSTGEYVKLEKARRTLGKMSDYDKTAELSKALKQLKNNEISEAEYYKKQGEINYNANISYLGLATSFALGNSPKRGYELYDIKAKNIRKGINLAAMGFTARDYRKMAKAVDADGNGYPKKQEIIDYVSKSGVKDKATLYDALYYYRGKYNPFGTPTDYTRAQARAVGIAKKVEQISDEVDEFDVDVEETSGGRGYYRRGWRRWHRWGGGGWGSYQKTGGNGAKVSKTKVAVAKSKTYQARKAKKASLPSVKSSTVKANTEDLLSAALRDIQRTEAKVSPPKPKGGKK